MYMLNGIGSQFLHREGVGLVGERRTPERDVGVRSSLRSPCCVLEQDTLPPKKYW